MPIRSVTSGMVAGGLGRQVGNLLLWYDAHPSVFVDLRDAINDEHNYQAEIPLAPSRQFHPYLNGQPSQVLVAAGVAQGDGPAGSIGQPVANPQDAGEHADAQLERYLRDKVIAYRFQLAQQQAGGVEQIPTPDVGGPV